MSVVIDTNLTDELIKEGLARELVSKIQTMRKEAGFEVVDHIEVGYECESVIEDILLGDDSIKSGVLCDKMTKGIEGGFVKEWDINGHNVVLSVKKI